MMGFSNRRRINIVTMHPSDIEFAGAEFVRELVAAGVKIKSSDHAPRVLPDGFTLSSMLLPYARRDLNPRKA